MFPSTNTPHIAAPQWPEARRWEASDRPSAPAAPARADSPTAASGWRAAAGRAFGLARAFLTLDDPALAADAAGRPHAPADAPAHPHRQPLRSGFRSRRPGAAAPRHQHCLTPVTRKPGRVAGWTLR
jgi:hypothetical protein